MLNVKGKLAHLKSSFLSSIYAQESSVIGRQRVAVLVYSSASLIAGVILNSIGLVGPVAPFFKLANLSQGVLVFMGLCLYYNRRISLSMSMSFYCIVLQVEISVETIYCVLHQNTYDITLILANVALSAVVLLLGIISYLRIVPFVVASLALTTYAISIYMTDSNELANYFVIFLAIFMALTLMGNTMTHNISRLDKENSELKEEKKEMLNLFQLTGEEMRSYITLAKTKNLEPAQTAELLTAVGNVAEKRILDNVSFYLRQSSIEFEKLQERLPELSNSELEICTLILKEKKLKDIAELLGKSRSNITCQRTNIRSKLNMKPGDNLHEVLKKRMLNMN